MANLTFGGEPFVTGNPFIGNQDLKYSNDAWNSGSIDPWRLTNLPLDMGRVVNDRTGETNTASLDGQSNFVSWLSGLGSAVLQSTGASGEQQATQVAYRPGGGGGGISTNVILAAAAVGVGLYLWQGR